MAVNNRIVKKIYNKISLETAKKYVKSIDYSERERKNNIQAYLPIFYGKHLLDGNVAWMSNPIKTTLQGGSVTRDGIVYYALFMLAGENYEQVRFPAESFLPAFVDVLDSLDFEGAMGYYFSVRTDWVMHWARKWAVSTGAEYVVGTGTVFTNLYRGDGSSGLLLNSELRVSEWENWPFRKEYSIPRSIYDELTLIQQLNLQYSWYNDFISNIEIPYSAGYITNQGDLYSQINIPSFQNIGNEDSYIPESGIYASKMPGIVTLGLTFAQLGNEEAKGPALRIIVSKPSTWYKEIILDLLYRAGHDITRYTKNNFNVPDDDDPEYYLDFLIGDQMSFREAIEKIIERTGTQLYYLDRYYIKEKYQTDYTSAGTLNQDEIGFDLSGQEMEEIPRIYKGYWNDRDDFFMDEYQKEVSICNDSIVTANGPVDKNIDIDGLQSEAAAVKMISKVMKNETWPKFYGTIETSMAGYRYQPGDVITLNLPDYLPGQIDMEIQKKEIGDETISFEVVQIAPISTQNAGGTEEYEAYVEANIPVIDDATIIEIPENTRYEHQSVLLLSWNMTATLLEYLAANSSFVYQILLYKSSVEAGPYSFWKNTGDETLFRRIISANGTLAADIYESGREHTEETDTSNYILVDGLNYESSMVIDDIAILKIENEYIVARAVSKVGSSWRFYGYQKRLFGSEPADHLIGVEVDVFICHPGESSAFGFDADWSELSYRNILETDEECYIKPIILKKGLNEISSISNTPAIHIIPTGEAEVPLKVGRIKAVRTGSNVDIDWHPISNISAYDGAGIKRAQDQLPPEEPWPHEGDFKYQINGGGMTQTSDYTLTISDASAFTLEVLQVRSGIEGESRICVIGAADGTYINGIKID